MAVEITAMALAACQLAVTVVPLAVAAWPTVWEQIVKTLKRLPRMHSDHGVNTNLATIHTILDTLEHILDLPWASLSHIQALLSSMKLRAESVEKMLMYDSTMKKFLNKPRVARSIRSIAIKMKILETYVLVHRQASITMVRPNADWNRLGPVQSYKRSQENLHNDLLAKLSEDNLEQVPIMTNAEYDRSMGRSGTYKAISYEFSSHPASGYPRTLIVSRSVRECIEVLLRWLRDLKLNRDTSNVEFAGVIGVAFIEVFTEILPEALLHHFHESYPGLEPRATLQFYENVKFFRSFSRSATFKAIQGKDGLDLDDDDKVSLDLQDSGWTAWNNLHEAFVELRDQGAASNHRFLGESSSGGSTLSTSEHADPAVCVICGIFINDAGDSVNNERIRKQHFDACFQKALSLNTS